MITLTFLVSSECESMGRIITVLELKTICQKAFGSAVNVSLLAVGLFVPLLVYLRY